MLKNTFAFKEHLPREFDSLLLYKFTCNTCNSIYIGETKLHFTVRSHEHMGISLLTKNSLKFNDTYATAVHKHRHDNGHVNSINNFEIVGHALNKFQLKLKESLLISREKPDIINVQKKLILLRLFN